MSYRIQRGREKIALLRVYPGFGLTEAEVESALYRYVRDDYRELLWLIISTTCVSAAADRVGIGQGTARQRMIAMIKFLARYHEPEVMRIVSALELVRDHASFNWVSDTNHWVMKRRHR